MRQWWTLLNLMKLKIYTTILNREHLDSSKKPKVNIVPRVRLGRRFLIFVFIILIGLSWLMYIFEIWNHVKLVQHSTKVNGREMPAILSLKYTIPLRWAVARSNVFFMAIVKLGRHRRPGIFPDSSSVDAALFFCNNLNLKISGFKLSFNLDRNCDIHHVLAFLVVKSTVGTRDNRVLTLWWGANKLLDTPCSKLFTWTSPRFHIRIWYTRYSLGHGAHKHLYLTEVDIRAYWKLMIWRSVAQGTI